MIPVYQTLTVNKDGTGNCVAACLASVLERPLRELPSILPNNTDNFWGAWNGWLQTHDLRLRFHPLTLGHPSGYHFASGITDRVYPECHPNQGEEIMHMVVCYDGLIIHDPFPGGEGLKEIKYYWTLLPRTHSGDD